VILLDTHAWLWWAQGAAGELPAALYDTITRSTDVVSIASVSCLEVAWLVKRRRVDLPLPIDDFFTKAIDEAGLVLIPLTPRIAARSAFLPDIHRDPIDRVLIATALEYDAELATRDEIIGRYPGVRVRWG
jgi:PIN domain nuclease of toxin-antitoxin system